MLRLRRNADGSPMLDATGTAARVEDEGGTADWLPIIAAKGELAPDDQALLDAHIAGHDPAATIAPVATETTQGGVPVQSGATPPLCMETALQGLPGTAPTGPVTTPPVSQQDLARELARELAGRKEKGGRPPSPGPSPEADAAAVELTRAKAAVERRKADALWAKTQADLRREQELHEVRMARERERQDARPRVVDVVPTDLARLAQESALRAQIERNNLEAEIARTTAEDYAVQREEEIATITGTQPPSGGVTTLLGCSGWVFGFLAGAVTLGVMGEDHYWFGMFLTFILFPLLGAFLVAWIPWKQYRAKVAQRKADRAERESDRRRQEWIARRNAQDATMRGVS